MVARILLETSFKISFSLCLVSLVCYFLVSPPEKVVSLLSAGISGVVMMLSAYGQRRRKP